MTDSNNKTVSQPVTTQAIVFNVLELAEVVEDVIKPHIEPYQPGIYLPHSLDPVLVPGGVYFYEVIDSPQTSQNFSSSYRYVQVGDIKVALTQPWDILDAPEGKLIVSHAQLRTAKEEPQLPVRGLKLIHDIIFNTAFSQLAYGDYPVLEKNDIVKKHIDLSINMMTSPVQSAQNHMLKEKLNAITDKVYSECAATLRYIHTFIGEKGMYAMYELNFHTSTTLSLVYKGDYRIMDWQRKMDEGTWA